jgi:hypothetical protein
MTLPLVFPAELRDRFREFIRRLTAVAPFSTFQEAWAGLAGALDGVEDEFSGIKKNPDQTNEAPPDGRMYPPHPKREVSSGAAGVRSFRQKAHLTSFADNGAIEVVKIKDARPVQGPPDLDKAGSDGRRVADYRTGTT